MAIPLLLTRLGWANNYSQTTGPNSRILHDILSALGCTIFSFTSFPRPLIQYTRCLKSQE
ncbi:hypothetical protein K443DRAFT_82446 [Laccaria amethystina LaAM-08-1]|uniref:Uncharacterized protein n=1 Tax=Laccaria amethystina LaAM-08-1 TaxID=1095629 RepID=A0A0C9XBP3_9AGAR|nr:hypothetical protein K443DRAFT_82446 [Laccaria amethystina LaAM-08-1]